MTDNLPARTNHNLAEFCERFMGVDLYPWQRELLERMQANDFQRVSFRHRGTPSPKHVEQTRNAALKMRENLK